ncbi:MAG: hypothetical protein HY820_07615 [Acidobacteria bacterium]|nr:hypothetical protein [Acidobacteriota bacterium]
MTIAGVLAGAGAAGATLALGVAYMYQAWLLEFVRLQNTMMALGRW